uniref:SnoaL-like domain-containing protein n=1 Tax=Minutocellus polymorphus TaxID=265543 RepID=A0A7S0FQ04_9STRA|mmetsp:Transcript_2133/g.3602  ORF Transcript_2133/g.3602 Transcript_2133/m.3602 type:complete len:261 (+) Transcript_2133:91-873(+)
MGTSTPRLLGLLFGLALLNTHPAHSFQHGVVPKNPNVPMLRSSSLFLPLCATGTSDSDDDKSTTDGGVVKEDMNPLTRASWYAVEAFGKVFGSDASGGASADAAASAGDVIDFSKPPSSLKEALRRIELDNERQYFLSGEVDVEAYDPDCLFADPFVSFNGRQRFVDNLANLGSFITKYDARPLGYEVSDDECTVQTKIMVKLELNLPWKPVLAWPWGVQYEIDSSTKLITAHVESWDIEPWAGVKQIFRKPTVAIAERR